MRIQFGKDCVGCGACTMECPEVFEFDADMFTVKVNPNADPSKYADAVRSAADVCPVSNIEILEP